MSELPLGKADYSRQVAREARIQTRNRYYEKNPILNDTGTAMIARPALKRFLRVGDGPIRALYSQSGDFEEALFVISGSEWYRVDLDKTVTFIAGDLLLGSSPQMAATGSIGDGSGAVPAYLFMADGKDLYCYVEDGYANNRIVGTPSNGDVIEIVGTITSVYKFTNGGVDVGTPDGGLANPWLVSLAGSPTEAWTNFGNAINNAGNPGTDYSTALEASPDVQMISAEVNSVFIRANVTGIIGNGYATTVPTGTDIAWDTATLTGGGEPSVFQVPVPGDLGAISVGYLAGYIVVIPVQATQFKGRFYWINPGETTIDPLNFATAERSPDPVFDVVVFGDQFWLPGATTTEIWYFTGNINAPVQRLQGVTFERGTWEGTAKQVKESMIIVDSDGGVFQMSGGLNRISTPDIEERIRNAIVLQSFLNPGA